MDSNKAAEDLTQDVKDRAKRSGFDLIGIVSAETYDVYPGHYIGHREYLCNTKKTTDYMKDARTLIILGMQVWDDLFDMTVKVGDHLEYPDEWRGRYYTRRMIRYLNSLGYKTVLEPELLSKKRMAQMGGIGSFGKQSLIIHPEYGPWIRLRSILTDVELVPTVPFNEDLCGDCLKCVESCPTGALTPYKVDPDLCLLGMPYRTRLSEEYRDVYLEHSPMLTENTWKMCNTCQQAYPIGKEKRHRYYGRSEETK